MVRFLQTSADWNWILLETKDGQQGWVHVENFEVVELRKNVMDVKQPVGQCFKHMSGWLYHRNISILPLSAPKEQSDGSGACVAPYGGSNRENLYFSV